MSNYILIKTGSIVDPIDDRVYISDVLVRDGLITSIEKDIDPSDDYKIIDAKGLLVVPGLVDLHVHFREPGYEHKETLETGMAAAVTGGFTTVACMPNTEPTIDNPAVVRYLNSRAKDIGLADLKVIGSITQGLMDKELADIEGMKKEGIVAISDDGKTPMDEALLDDAFKRAQENNLIIISHCEDHRLSKDGHINAGSASERTGIKGIPAQAEFGIVKRDIKMSEKYNVPVHIAHVSVGESIDIIREHKTKGTQVTCEVAPHHFILDDTIISRESTLTKVNPPIRSREDVNKIIEGIREGTIDIIATDHAPHDIDSKATSYEKASFGITGLETSFSLAYTRLVGDGVVSLPRLLYMMSIKPLKIMGIISKGIAIGERADIALIDKNQQYKIDSSGFVSKGKNTPFNGYEVKSRVMMTIKNGNIVYEYKEAN